jgi:lysozyme family protein
MNLDKVLEQSIATALFDMGVLCGTGTAARLCQEVLGVKQIKKIDSITLDAINTTTDEQFIPEFAKSNIQRFEEIVNRNRLRSWRRPLPSASVQRKNTSWSKGQGVQWFRL